MRPKIQAYLRDNGARYTTKALRQWLISAGYDPAEVDVALAETASWRNRQLAETQLRSRFWGLAFLVNIIVLVSATVLTSGASFGGAVFLVLGIALLLALIVTGNIGKLFLGSRGLFVALLIPTVGALLLGGWCVSLMGVRAI